MRLTFVVLKDKCFCGKCSQTFLTWRRNEFGSRGGGPPQKWGQRSSAKRRIFFCLASLRFGSKSTISRFGERFRDGQYSLVSVLFAVLLTVPSCPKESALQHASSTSRRPSLRTNPNLSLAVAELETWERRNLEIEAPRMVTRYRSRPLYCICCLCRSIWMIHTIRLTCTMKDRWCGPRCPDTRGKRRLFN